jgi:L-asparaginase II
LAGAVPLATVVRSGVVESIHLGHVVVCDSGGRLLASAGDPDRVVFARSSMKPLQAAVSLSRIDDELTDDEVAIMCGSHNGEDIHVETVGSILRRAGVDASALRCPPAWPWYPEDARLHDAPARELHNCSGKHAGMVLAAARGGDPLETYPDPDHPLQRNVLEAVLRMTDSNHVDVGVDGCGVPVHAMPLRAMATLFARLARPAGDEPLADRIGACAGAMRARPYLVAGRDRADTALMQAVDGLLAKGGAEGLACAAVEDRGIGVAVRIDDGSSRAAAPALLRALALLEVVGEEQLETLERFARPPVLGGGRPVGALTSTIAFD